MPQLEFADLDLASGLGAQLLREVEARHGPALAAAARLPRRLFIIRSAWAPGLAFVGGEADARDLDVLVPEHPAFSLAGSGDTLSHALASCLGEGVERMSQIERAGDVVARGVGDALFSGVRADLERLGWRGAGDGEPAWCRARHLGSGEAVLVPADWCLRRVTAPYAIPDAALSTGTAAGPSVEAATERALLECVERDAAALWWLGGRRGAPMALESDAMIEAARLIDSLRQGETLRRTWLLDLTTEFAIPVIAAISVDENGFGFVCGLAARRTLNEAARAAIFEMAQLEIGLQLVALKSSARGPASLTDVDRRAVLRATRIDAGTCEFIHPLGTPRATGTSVLPGQDSMNLGVAAALRAHGIEAAVVDLKRTEFGLPVVHACVPDLQALPSAFVTGRLAQVQAATGADKASLSRPPLH